MLHNETKQRTSKSQDPHNGLGLIPPKNCRDKTIYTQTKIDNVDTPFWVPSNNVDLFQLREIFRTDKERKKVISKQRQKPGIPLPMTVKCYQQGVNQKSNIYLTEPKLISDFNFEKMSTVPSELKSELNLVGTVSTGSNTAYLQKIVEEREKEKKRNQVEENKKNTIEAKTDAINVMRRDSVREYINKTRQIVLMKYSTDIKKERAVRLTEEYSNDIESIKDSIKSIEDARGRFSEEFLVRFSEYVKKLYAQLEKEKGYSIDLKEIKLSLEKKIRVLENKIRKQEAEKESSEKWRDFLIQVKEKKATLPPYYFSILSSKAYTPRDNPSPQEKQLTTLKRRNTSSTTIPNDDEILRVQSYKTTTIFNSVEELFDEMQKRESDNINLLNQYNEISLALKEDQEELRKLKEEDKNTNENTILAIKNKTKECQALRERNEQLLYEQKVLEDKKSKKVFFKPDKKLKELNIHHSRDKFSQPLLFGKILAVFHSAKELILPNENESTMKKLKATNEEMALVSMVERIEMTLDFLVSKEEFYKSAENSAKYKEMFDKVKKDIDQERKQQKANEQKELDLYKSKKLQKEIEDRNNKIYVLPIRKVPQAFQMFKKKVQKKKNDDDENKEPDFYDLMQDVLDANE